MNLSESMNWIRRNVNAALATATPYTIVNVTVPAGMQLELYGWTVMCGTASNYCHFQVLKESATGPAVFQSYISNGTRVNLPRPVVLPGGQTYWLQMAHEAGSAAVLAGTIYGRMAPSGDDPA